MTTKWKKAIVFMCTAGLFLFPQGSHADSGKLSSHYTSSPRRNNHADTATSLLQLLPKESTLVGESSAKHPAEINTSRTALLTFKMSGHSYVVGAFGWRHQLGILIARPTKNGFTKVWSHTGFLGESLTLLKTVFLSGTSSPEILAGTYLGASGGNQWTIIGWQNNNPKILFQRIANRMDIGKEAHLSANQFAQWNHNTGPLYVIHIFGWKNDQFIEYPNSDVPAYYQHVVIPYYLTLSRDHTAPIKMVDYGLAQGYVYAGDYEKAQSVIHTALKIKGYPDNTQFIALQKVLEVYRSGYAWLKRPDSERK